jgi:hypothetical protein
VWYVVTDWKGLITVDPKFEVCTLPCRHSSKLTFDAMFCFSFFVQGITPILPIFREAILNGLPEVKEHAAQGLGEVIKLTSAEALQPSVVHITGPLIRILGDRFNWNVKAAVLETLALLLAKVKQI